MDKKWIAHRTENGRIQTIKEHLEGTAAYCERFASSFGAGDIGRLTGLAHDLGKFSEAFQKRIYGASISVDHSTAGAFETKDVASAFSILGHHGGIPDKGGRGDIGGSTFFARQRKYLQGEIEAYSTWKDEIVLPVVKTPSCFHVDERCYSFFTRMLFSCLVDSDYLDTEAFYEEKVRGTNSLPISQLMNLLDRYTDAWKNPTNELNYVRTKILENCLIQGEEKEPGIYSMTVPTGGGKTISSLMFALHHAKKNNLKRIIYVIPYTSIIEQTSAIFKAILGKDNVLEHHSGIVYDEKELRENKALYGLKLASENWDIPIIVTTAVQFFESFYSNRPAKCRKLHNVAESVVIFDEAQMIPVSQLKPCVYTMAQLAKNYRTTILLCTATQPALEDVFRQFLPDIRIDEICSRDLYQQKIFNRVVFRNMGECSWAQLLDELREKQQVLCIVNRRKNAQEIYSNLKDIEGSFHLTTLMCPAHRKQVLDQIRMRLKSGQTCRVIATSLIEAGVDVDFPFVYREIAGLDSILQAAGRCNREGKRSRESSIVSVFKSEDSVPELFALNAMISEQVLEKYQEINSEDAIRYYFQTLRKYLNSDSAQDMNGVFKISPFDFSSIDSAFHLIDSNTYTIYVPFDEGEELLKRFHAGEQTNALVRLLARYSVPVYIGQLKKLEEAGAITPLYEGTSEQYELINPVIYSTEMGLNMDTGGGDAFFI